MTNTDKGADRKDITSDDKARDAGTAEDKARTQELTEEEMDAVHGGEILTGCGGGSGKWKVHG